ncbi:MerR family transcriptional regulator [Streptomyces tanashiensis]|uniref:MerR family transcriptional regulator n=1 Tax=Streptomyces tanashiensis TaxID=67367 RepID=UPI0033EBC884
MRIGELASKSALSTKTIRFYEQAGLLPAPPRTSFGYRDYPNHAVSRLSFVRDAQAAGLTLARLRRSLGRHEAPLGPRCRRGRSLTGTHPCADDRIGQDRSAGGAVSAQVHRVDGQAVRWRLWRHAARPSDHPSPA